MKNVTISLDEHVAQWLRVEAAKAGKSMSRFVGDHFAAQAGRSMTQLEALEKFLAGPPLPGAAAAFNREELYAEREDELLSRYQSADLRPRPGGTGKTGESGPLAKDDRPRGRPRPQRPKHK